MKKSAEIQSSLPGALSRRTILKATGAIAAPLVSRYSRAATEIPIGVCVGLTGAAADFGRDAQRAIQLVVDRVNRAGGIKSLGGATIKLIVADHQSELRIAASETERLISREGVLGVIGWASSGAARVGSEVSERYQVASIDGSSDYMLTERGLKYYYRAGTSTRKYCEQGVQFVKELEKTKGISVKRVAILHEDQAFGTGAGDLFKIAIEREPGWKLVDRIAYTGSKLNEATGIVNKLKSQNVDVVFQASYPADGILIQRAMKQLRLDLVANVHASGAPPNVQYLGNLKKDAEYVFTTLGWTPSMVKRLPTDAKETVAEYVRRYKVELQDQAASSLSSAAAMIAALSKIKSLDRAELWQAIDKVDLTFGQDPNIVIPFGVKWDEKHDNAKSQPVVTQILGQEFAVVRPKEMATAEPVAPVPAWDKRTS